MAGAFNNAWTLLKNRGFEVMPRQRAGPSLAPTMQQQLEALESGDFSQVEEAERLEERRNKTEEREIDPMTRHLLNQQAEDIEAEGIELPDMPSSGPPADTDYGRAGSSNPARVRPIDVFSPTGVKLQQEQQRVRSQLKPILSEEELLRPSSAPNEFITADDFMRPPVQKSFDEAWNLLKEDPLKTRSDQLAQTPLGQALTATREAPKPQPLDFTPRDDQGQELQYFPEDQEPMTHTEMVQAYGPDFQERFGDRVNPFQVSVEELKRRQQQGEQQ